MRRNLPVSLLADAIAHREGYGKPGAVPTRDNNPGDLRHSPHASHTGEGPNDIGIIDTPADGWADLERQLRLYADRGLTIADAIGQFAPPNENDTEDYLVFVCHYCGCAPTDLVSDVLGV